MWPECILLKVHAETHKYIKTVKNRKQDILNKCHNILIYIVMNMHCILYIASIVNTFFISLLLSFGSMLLIVPDL